MSEESMEIPIGADMKDFNEALGRVVAAFDQVGAQINAAFARANAAVEASTARMRANQSASQQSAAAATQVGAAFSSAGTKISGLISVAGKVGDALSGAAAGIGLASKASRILSGVSLGTHLTGWIARAGGVRAAFAKIPAAMSAIANNPALRRVVIGAGGAVAGIIAIRPAWRTAAAGTAALRSAAAATFSSIVSGAQRAGSAVKSSFASIGSLPGKLAGALPGLPIAGILGGVGGLAGAVGIAVKSIAAAAEIETLETAFAPLIGGAENAKKRIAELSQFAIDTPFELPEVAQASRVLEVLTKGALSTGEGLRMVGDIASTTNQPFQEIAMWIGRLYDGLQSGRPVGEAIARLQELGVVSGDVRSRIEKLQEEGAAGGAIWDEAAAALGRFGGAMDRQSQTWSGKLSNLRGSVDLLMGSLGKPIMDGLKPFLDMAIARIDSMKTQAAELGEKIKNAFNAGLAAFQTGNAFEFVSLNLQLAMVNSVNTFVAGMQAGLTALAPLFSALWSGLKESGIINTLESAFRMLGELMAAGMYKAVGILQSGLREAAISYAKTVNPLFGEKLALKVLGKDKTNDFDQASESAMQRAGIYAGVAKAGLSSIDLNAGGKAMQGKMKEAMDEFQKNFAAALADPALNPTELQDRIKALEAKYQERMKQNQADIDARVAALDKNLPSAPASPTGDNSPIAAIARAIQPAVTSLGRVGGGGSGGAFTPLVSEQKRTNGLLARYLPHLAERKGLRVIA